MYKRGQHGRISQLSDGAGRGKEVGVLHGNARAKVLAFCYLLSNFGASPELLVFASLFVDILLLFILLLLLLLLVLSCQSACSTSFSVSLCKP